MHVRVERDARTRTPAHNERERLGLSASALTHAQRGYRCVGKTSAAFHRAASFLNPAQLAMLDRPARSPAKKRASTSPAKQRATKSPAKQRAAKSPAKERAAKSPAKERAAAKSPAKERAAKSPAKRAAKSPAKERAAKSPIKERPAKSPAKEVAASPAVAMGTSPRKRRASVGGNLRWTPAEEARLRAIVLETAEQKDRWTIVAAALGTNRSATGAALPRATPLPRGIC